MAAAVATATQTPAEYRHRTYDLKTPAEHRALYDEWAASYNDEVMGSSTLYVGPKLTAEAVLAANGNINGPILDAGCGTGLCGVALAKIGAKVIDGIDYSPGMLKVANKTGAYRNLVEVDMSKPTTLPNATYDVVTCVGTFTTGHVGPDPAIGELVRVLKQGGVLAATVLDNIWEPQGYAAEVNRLKEAGLIEVLSTEIVDYRKAEEAMARMVVLRKN